MIAPPNAPKLVSATRYSDNGLRRECPNCCPAVKHIVCSITRQQFCSLMARTATAARLLEFVSGLLDPPTRVNLSTLVANGFFYFSEKLELISVAPFLGDF